VLDRIGNPDTITLSRIRAEATGEFLTWVMDRKNRRIISYRLEVCGYVRVRNDDADDGMWKIRLVQVGLKREQGHFLMVAEFQASGRE
jgi:hypothetical protein